ncbi:MAG: histidinol-phosphatase [Magnetococcales bacterium]|nr:histidinol-phosphatase [Magnetococcales bacterium]
MKGIGSGDEGGKGDYPEPLWRAVNLHTHTWRCQHARGDVAEYVLQARERGLRVLGMSDHTPMPDGRWGSIRMALEDLDGYDRAVEAARSGGGTLRVLKGMECEFVPEFTSFYRETLLGERKFDYLAGGIHLFLLDGEWVYVSSGVRDARGLRAYTDFFIEAMRSGLYAFMAHPDLFASAWQSWDREAAACTRAMLEAAADLGVPLEINANGLRQWPIRDGATTRQPYPWSPFWEMAAGYRIKALVSADAHRPEEIHDAATCRAFTLAEEWLDPSVSFSWLDSFADSRGA